jgi:hypothetical protein
VSAPNLTPTPLLLSTVPRELHSSTLSPELPLPALPQPDVPYDDVGGAGEALEKLREVVELPLLHPERFVTLGIEPPKVRSAAPAAVLLRAASHAAWCAPACRAFFFGARPARARRCPPAQWPTGPTRASSVSLVRVGSSAILVPPLCTVML